MVQSKKQTSFERPPGQPGHHLSLACPCALLCFHEGWPCVSHIRDLSFVWICIQNSCRFLFDWLSTYLHVATWKRGCKPEQSWKRCYCERMHHGDFIYGGLCLKQRCGWCSHDLDTLTYLSVMMESRKTCEQRWIGLKFQRECVMKAACMRKQQRWAYLATPEPLLKDAVTSPNHSLSLTRHKGYSHPVPDPSHHKCHANSNMSLQIKCNFQKI